MIAPHLTWIDVPGRPRIACRILEGSSPSLLFLPGYASDMEGTKALALHQFARRRGIGLTRFDYSGTGSSEGDFEQCSLADWLQESLAVLDRTGPGPVVLVGSSMGGWLALHLALRRPQKVVALIGIAAAPDFTVWGMSEADKAAILRDGRLERPDSNGGPSQVTSRTFWESGQQLLLLDEPIMIDCPVRLVHGECDGDVPLSVAMRLMRQLRSADVHLTIIKGGGHRLSEPREIAAILRTVESVLEPQP